MIWLLRETKKIQKKKSKKMFTKRKVEKEQKEKNRKKGRNHVKVVDKLRYLDIF